jgi:N-dimethylarginine dimethylaminohydrolase
MFDTNLALKEHSIDADLHPCLLMSAPHYLNNSSPNNAQMIEIKKLYGDIDRVLAMKQFKDIYAHVSKSAWVYLLPAVKGLQDQIYVSNLGVILNPDKNAKSSAVVSNFYASERKGEEYVGMSFLEALGFDVVKAPNYFEGEADLKNLTGNIYVGAYGLRTSSTVFEWFEREYGIRVIACKMQNPYLYHLDCVYLKVNDETVAMVTSILEPAFVREVERHMNVVDVPIKAALAGATNCLRLNDEILIDDNSSLLRNEPSLYANEKSKIIFIEQISKKFDLAPHFFHTSEFIKSGAALSCLFLSLNGNHYVAN